MCAPHWFTPQRNPDASCDQETTAIIEREGNGYVALCPELDIASRGESMESARENLREAIELFYATASCREFSRKFKDAIYVTPLEVNVG